MEFFSIVSVIRGMRINIGRKSMCRKWRDTSKGKVARRNPRRHRIGIVRSSINFPITLHYERGFVTIAKLPTFAWAIETTNERLGRPVAIEHNCNYMRPSENPLLQIRRCKLRILFWTQRNYL